MTEYYKNDGSRQQRLDQVLADYMSRLDRGDIVDREQFLAEHPDLIADLRAYFETADRIDELAGAAAQSPAEAIDREAATLPPSSLVGGEFQPGSATPPLASADPQSPARRDSGQPSTLNPQPSGTRLRYFGDYELLEEIARGGMGVVYKARQVSLNRIVAVKMILAGQLAGLDDVRRFRTEAEAAAQLQHPNIVSIHEVGEHDGQHYFSMDYVEGPSLASLIRENPLPAKQAAAIVKTVAEAIQYAHAKGILHRDLKPSNILLQKSEIRSTKSETKSNDPSKKSKTPRADVSDIRNSSFGIVSDFGFRTSDFVPKVTDFGLAKRIEGGSELTGTGQILGTPSYMPPEQTGAKRGEIGPASDVYSLGAILYELLTGRPPFRADTPLDTLLQVLESEPVAPRLLNPKIDKDVETICLKCMYKEPPKRYGTAQALADDLGRYVNGEPIQARPVGRVERSWRWCRRNPVVATLAACVAALLVVIPIGTSVAALKLRRERNTALANLERAERAEEDGKKKLWTSLLAQAQAGRWSGRAGRRFESLDALAAAARIRPALELRNEAIACMALTDLRMGQQWQGFPAGTQYIVFDDSVERYARADAQANVSVRCVADDQEIARLPAGGNPLQFFGFLGFSPDGHFLAVGYRDTKSGHFDVWDLNRNETVLSVPNGINLVAADFSPDSRRVAVGHSDSSISIYELASGTLWKRLPPGVNPYTLRFHPNGEQLAVSSHAATVQIRDLETGAVRRSITLPGQARGIAWHPDGKLLAGACGDNRVYIWDTGSGERHAVLEGHLNVVADVVFSHAGDLLASTGWDARLKLWDPWSAKQLVDIPGIGTSGYTSLRFRRDDQRLAYGLVGSKVVLWNVADGREAGALGVPAGLDKGRLWDVDMSPDGRLLAAAWSDGVHLWDFAVGKEIARLPGHTRSAIFDPVGSDLFTWGTNGLFRWPITLNGLASDSQIGPPQYLGVPGSNLVEWASISADGRTLALGDRSRGQVIVLDTKTQKVLLRGTQPNPSRIAISPDGHWVASGTWKDAASRVRIWNVATEEHVRDLPIAEGTHVAFSLDSKWLVTSTGEECRFWEVGTWQPGRAIATESPGRGSFALSRDGIMMAVSAAPGLVGLRDQTTGNEFATLPVSLPSDAKMCFSPDGIQLLAITEGQVVQVWDLWRIRTQLAELNLDWDRPPFALASNRETSKSIQLRVDVGNLARPFKPPPPAAEQKLDEFTRAIKADPRNGEAYHQRGHLQEQLGQLQKAIEDYSEALKGQPRSAHLYAERARVYQRLGELEKAAADLEKALEFQPDQPLLCNNLAWMYVAGPAAVRKPDRAVELAQRAVQSAQNDWTYLNTLGVAYYRAGKFEKAVETLLDAGKANKDGPTAFEFFVLAMSYHQLGQADKARDCFEHAIKWCEAHPQVPLLWTEDLKNFRTEAETILAKPQGDNPSEGKCSGND